MSGLQRWDREYGEWVQAADGPWVKAADAEAAVAQVEQVWRAVFLGDDEDRAVAAYAKGQADTLRAIEAKVTALMDSDELTYEEQTGLSQVYGILEALGGTAPPPA